jgi:hypothetical protein
VRAVWDGANSAEPEAWVFVTPRLRDYVEISSAAYVVFARRGTDADLERRCCLQVQTKSVRASLDRVKLSLCSSRQISQRIGIAPPFYSWDSNPQERFQLRIP